MEVMELFQALQAAYVKVKEREEVRDQAQAFQLGHIVANGGRTELRQEFR